MHIRRRLTLFYFRSLTGFLKSVMCGERFGLFFSKRKMIKREKKLFSSLTIFLFRDTQRNPP